MKLKTTKGERENAPYWTQAARGTIASALLEDVETLRAALTTYAVTMSYDYPAEAPVECGLWCDLCKEHIDNGAGHKPTCLLA